MVKIQVNSQGKAYYTSAGKVLLANEGGRTPNIESLSVTPTTSSQTISATGNVDGYSPINVAAVTSAIDSNIVAGNIKKDVSILGVTGSYEGSGGGGIGITREVKNGVYQMPTTSFTFSLPSDATNVGDYGLTNAFYNSTGLTSVDLSSLTRVSGRNALDSAFEDCSALTSVDLSSLTTISGEMGLYRAFYGCDALTSVDLSSLTIISGNDSFQHAFLGCSALTSIDFPALTIVGRYAFDSAFNDCSKLTSVDFSALTTVGDNSFSQTFRDCSRLTTVDFSALTTVGSRGFSSAFMGCTFLTTVDFSALTTIDDGGFGEAFQQCTFLRSVDFPALTTVGSRGFSSAFMECSRLTDIYFRALTTSSFSSDTDQFDYMMMMTATSTTHTIHFPSNLESTIQRLDGYPLFGGTSGYVVLAFDLPATE